MIRLRKATIALFAFAVFAAAIPGEASPDVPATREPVTPPNEFKQFVLPPKNTIPFPEDLVPVQTGSPDDGHGGNRHLRVAPENSGRRLQQTSTVTIRVLYDGRPYDTSWQLSNDGGFVVAAQPAQTYFTPGGEITQTVVVAPGTYYWHIGDNQCDGLCCVNGYGGYWIYVDGVKVAEGNNFGCEDYKSFTVGQPVSTLKANNVVLDIMMDDYPSDLGWEITDSTGMVRGGMAPGHYTGMRAHVYEHLTLPRGWYTLTIDDAGGDGICCNYGDGSFVLEVNGYPVLDGGNYGANFSGDFYVNE